MLGRTIDDPAGIEGPPGRVSGLGLLDVETVLTGDKRLNHVSGHLENGASFTGYEMHLGRTTGQATVCPFLRLSDGRPDGAVCGRIAGTYVHALFTADPARAALLHQLGATPSDRLHEAEVDSALDALAAHLEHHLDLDRLLDLAEAPKAQPSPPPAG